MSKSTELGLKNEFFFEERIAELLFLFINPKNSNDA
jgi:hypothetical protein